MFQSQIRKKKVCRDLETRCPPKKPIASWIARSNLRDNSIPQYSLGLFFSNDLPGWTVVEGIDTLDLSETSGTVYEVDAAFDMLI